jgi:hypothetical protein
METSIFISVALFIAGALFDIFTLCVVLFLYHKITKTKLVVVENNQEILEHDKIIGELEKNIKALRNGGKC